MTLRIEKIRMAGFMAQDRETTIAPRTVITGRNGTGKTAHLYAVSTAILGFVPVIGKRSMGTLATASTMSVGLDLIDDDDGRTLSIDRSFAPKESVTLAPPVRGSLADRNREITRRLGECRAMIDLEEFLGLSPAKRADFLGTVLGEGGGITIDEVLEALDGVSEETAAAMRNAWFADRRIVENLDAMAAIVDDTVSRARRASEEAEGVVRRLTESIEEHSVGDTAATLTEERDRVRGDIESLTAEIAASQERAAGDKRVRKRITEAEGRLSVLQSEHERRIEANSLAANALEEHARDKPEEPEGTPDEAREEWQEAMRDLERVSAGVRQIEEGIELQRANREEFAREQTCPVAAIKCPAASDIGVSLEETGRRLDKKLTETLTARDAAAGEAAIAKRRWQDHEQFSVWRHAFEEKKRAVEASAEATTAAEKALTESRETVAALNRERDEAPAVIDVAEAEGQISTLRNRVAEIDQAIASAERARSMREELTEAERVAARERERAAEARRLQTGIKTTAAEFMARSFAPITETVRELIESVRPGMSIELRAEDKGIVPYIVPRAGAGGVRWRGASGGERAIAGAALALAMVKVQNPPAKFLLLEAGEIDTENLEALLEALSAMGGDFASIIVASWHARSVPEDWSVVALAS